MKGFSQAQHYYGRIELGVEYFLYHLCAITFVYILKSQCWYSHALTPIELAMDFGTSSGGEL